MKRTVSIFFLAIFIFNTMGYFLLFQAEKISIRKEVHSNIANGINDNRVSVLHAQKLSELIFDGDNEIISSGVHYDVLKIVKTENGLLVYAINDEKETFLNNGLSEHVASQCLPGEKSNNNSKTPGIKLIKLFCEDHFVFHPLITVSENTYSEFKQRIPESVSLSLFLPPKVS